DWLDLPFGQTVAISAAFGHRLTTDAIEQAAFPFQRKTETKRADRSDHVMDLPLCPQQFALVLQPIANLVEQSGDIDESHTTVAALEQQFLGIDGPADRRAIVDRLLQRGQLFQLANFLRQPFGPLAKLSGR